MAIHKNNFILALSKPAYIGIGILESSKVLMYEFHYQYTKNKYGNNSNLFFTDTDSLMYEIKTVDVYEDFSKLKLIMSMKILATIKKYLTFGIIQVSQNIMIIQTN